MPSNFFTSRESSLFVMGTKHINIKLLFEILLGLKKPHTIQHVYSVQTLKDVGNIDTESDCLYEGFCHEQYLVILYDTNNIYFIK